MLPHVHRTHRSAWLRAAVLGANDGVLSIASLMLGVAASRASTTGLYIAALAGLVGGALSMGAGEYVSVSSQADTERADIETERAALHQDRAAEQAELRDIYVGRGLDLTLAEQVAERLMQHDALAAHTRDDIGITEALAARPLQAAAASSLSFAVGGVVPLIAGVLSTGGARLPVIATVSSVSLGALGALAARAGGAPLLPGSLRVMVSGVAVMAITGGIGALVGAAL